jgi:hypothetical protein
MDAGHRKSTREREAERIGTSIPLTLTTMPDSSAEKPVGSEVACPSANHLPSRLAIAPGLQEAASEQLVVLTTRVTTGRPNLLELRNLQ